MNDSKSKKFNGPGILAAMFRELDPTFKKKLLEKIEKASPILVKTIEYLEFQIYDLIRLEDNSLELLIRTINDKDWIIAWKLMPEPLKTRLLENMSERKRDDFLAMCKNAPKVHKSQVFKVQMQIAKTTKELLQAGKLQIKSRRPLMEYQARLKDKIRTLSQQRAQTRKKK